jgi:hypothetical protein
MVTSSYDTVGGDLPLPLGGGQVAATAELDPDFDVMVSGLVLNLHITRDNPYRRETAEWRKQQVDQAPEAGEQSLSTWWLRSQMSFHGGAGIQFLDTIADPTTTNRIRFDDSRGMDVWTEGEIKPLPDTGLASATSGRTWMECTSLGGEAYTVYAGGTTVKANRVNAADTITYTVTGMSGTVKSMVTDGTYYYVATSDGHIFKGPIDNSAPGSAIWDFTSSATVALGWCKQRLVAGINNAVYELATGGPTLPTPIYTHPSAGWSWVSFAESPDAVIGAGKSGLNSSIFAFTITDVSGAPELAPGVVIATMPIGETINCLYLYVGTKLAIGTSEGLRVGGFDNIYGTFTYGPLTYDGAPVYSAAGRGAFLYCGTNIDSEAMLIRVDLGLQTEDQIYAWAPDLRVPEAGAGNGQVDAISVRNDRRMVFAVRNYGIVREELTYGNRAAWLRTARIRMSTVEPKQFKYARIRTNPGVGSLTVQAETDTTGAQEIYSIDLPDEAERFSLPPGKAEWLALTFTLTDRAVMTSYQVLSLPAQARQRVFSLPVSLFDHEVNRHEKRIGYPGRSKVLLDALEALEATGDEVTVQCPVLGIEAVRCTVERIEFFQQSPPTKGKSIELGGYANLIFRTSR